MKKPFAFAIFLIYFIFLLCPRAECGTDTTIKGTTASSAQNSLDVTNSADTSLLTVRNDGRVNVGGPLGILEGGSSPSFYTIFGGGDQSASITYTLPIDSANGFLRNVAGVLSWQTPTAAAGGSNTHVQFNDNGALSGDAGFVYNSGTTTATIATLNLTNDLAVTEGGTGASTAAGARTNLGTAASGANSDITSLSALSTALSVAQGGTGTATGSITGTGALSFSAGGTNQNLSLAPSGTGNLALNGPAKLSSTLSLLESGSTPTKYTIFAGGDQTTDITYTLPTSSSDGFLQNTSGVLSWGAAAESGDAVIGNEVTDAANATLTRSGSGTAVAPYKLAINLGNANTWAGTQAFGTASADTLTLTNDLAVTEGGTGASTAAGARTNLGTAASGANSDITSLSALSTALSVAQGGTGTATGSITGTGALSFSAGGTNQNVTLSPSGTGSTVLNSTVSIPSMSTAGFLKNSVTGLLSGGNSIVATDIPRSDLVNGTGISMGGTLTSRLVGSGDNVTINVGSTVPTSVVNDTNVTGSLASNALTLGWTGQLALTRGGTGASTQAGAANNILPSQTGNSGKFLTTNGTDASWGVSSGTNTDKMHITMFTTQASTISKSDPVDTVAITNIGTTPMGFGNAAVVRMDGFTTIRLIAVGADKAGQTGIVTLKVRDFTNSTDLVSLTFSDATVQFREATASIALTGLHNLVVQGSSDASTDDPLIGNIAIQLEM